MAKARILKVVNYREEDIANLTKLNEILKREGKAYTDWVREQGEKYIKVHGSGNPQYTLDKEVVAFPTPWATIGTSDLEGFSWKEADEMIKRLESALSTIKRYRQAKRDAEMRAKGLRPKA